MCPISLLEVEARRLVTRCLKAKQVSGSHKGSLGVRDCGAMRLKPHNPHNRVAEPHICWKNAVLEWVVEQATPTFVCVGKGTKARQIFQEFVETVWR